MEVILDTNVVVRYLVGDVPEQQQQARLWFAEAEAGTRQITLLSVVLAESVFVLESFYQLTRERIAESLTVLVSQQWLRAVNRDVLLQALVWYKGGMHIVDSY